MEHATKKPLSSKTDHIIRYDQSSYFQSLPESDLWELFKGDVRVFNHVYRKYFPILYHYGHQFTKDKELVKDMIQDLFIYLKEKSKRLGKTTSIKFYLYKAYRRRITRYLKKNRSDNKRTQRDYAGFEVALSQESTIINSAIDEELKQKLERAFGILTRRQREIIIYYFFEGFSYREITSVMGFSKVQYARILMSRSMAKLRRELADLRTIF